jgi:YVTN family beta-propeller protein
VKLQELPVSLRSALLSACIVILITPAASQPTPYLRAPALDEYAWHNPLGVTILPDGRFLRPEGVCLPVARFPHGLTMTRNGRTLFVASHGAGQLITGWDGPSPRILAVNAPVAIDASGGERPSNSGGADFSPDGRLLYWSSGETGKVCVFDAETGSEQKEIPLNGTHRGRTYDDSYAVDIKVSADGRHVYCADVTNFRVVVIDAERRRVVGSVQVGRYPYALAVNGATVFVANIGLFEYSAVPPPRDSSFDRRGLTFPPFGYPGAEARDGVAFEGRMIPGLGEPNVPESFSVWRIDVTRPESPEVVGKLKTGLLVGAPSENGTTVGGSAPNYLAVSAGRLYVSNGNNDIIERIDLRENRIAVRRRIVPSPLVEDVRGVSPAGMAASPDGKRVYVAEVGLNAVAVLDATSLSVIGHIPSAWYPYRVAVSPDGRSLAVACFRGFGNGPNAGARDPENKFLDMRGALQVLAVPSDDQLPKMTAEVLRNNGIIDRRSEHDRTASPVLPSVPGKASAEIRHVVFITKENHTYDTVFDRIPGANDDPQLLRWGLNQTIRAEGQPDVRGAGVMVNHNALARQFTVSDNFYMQPEASGVGHRWLVGVQPNTLMQMTYSVGWKFKAASTAPGRRYAMESNGSLIPEDYPEAGAMWDHLARAGIPFRNYGEGFEFPGVEEGENERPTGAREVVNIPMPKVLYDNTCREFPVFNMNIPDQYRAAKFIEDVDNRFVQGKEPFPSFLNIALCNDHGTDPRPDRGYPYVASWMADNDLALGRIVEYLSHTPWWRSMVIFVTEDDAGGEPDHVDAQRSVLLMISPWGKRGYVSHRHTTMLSMHRTMYEIFGLPPLNMFDALANDFSDCFTGTPDFRPYSSVSPDPRVFDPDRVLDRSDPDYRNSHGYRSPSMDDPGEMERVLKQGGAETHTGH